MYIFKNIKRGKPVDSVKKLGIVCIPVLKHILFRTKEIFTETTEYDFDVLSQRLRELAFLNAGIKINLNDLRFNNSEEFFYSGGIREFIKHINKGKRLFLKMLYF